MIGLDGDFPGDFFYSSETATVAAVRKPVNTPPQQADFVLFRIRYALQCDMMTSPNGTHHTLATLHSLDSTGMLDPETVHQARVALFKNQHDANYTGVDHILDGLEKECLAVDDQIFKDLIGQTIQSLRKLNPVTVQAQSLGAPVNIYSDGLRQRRVSVTPPGHLGKADRERELNRMYAELGIPRRDR